MKKRGFTLIELLAVIVILAIIALIAVPIVLNMIENARKSAAKSSAYGYIDAINNNNELASMKNNNMENIPDTINDGTYNVTGINIKIKGKKPTSGTLTITNGRVVSADLCINNYMVNYNNNEATVGEKCSGDSTSNTTSYSTGDGIYLDPTDLSKECTSGVSTTGTHTGCMKFYILNEDGDNYNLILDHNTSTTVSWNGDNYNTQIREVKARLESDTQGWVGSPRLVRAQEIADATNTTFDGGVDSYFYFDGTGTKKQTPTSHSKGENPYKWLFDNTYNCEDYGCDHNDQLGKYGYWTQDAVGSYNAWYVSCIGSLHNDPVYVSDNYGVRPVITIPKSQIK